MARVSQTALGRRHCDARSSRTSTNTFRRQYSRHRATEAQLAHVPSCEATHSALAVPSVLSATSTSKYETAKLPSGAQHWTPTIRKPRLTERLSRRRRRQARRRRLRASSRTLALASIHVGWPWSGVYWHSPDLGSGF